jgi:hypothetical protein
VPSGNSADASAGALARVLKVDRELVGNTVFGDDADTSAGALARVLKVDWELLDGGPLGLAGGVEGGELGEHGCDVLGQ